MHNYAKLSDTHVADSVHGCIEADAGYSKNMNDQCANRSPNNLKVAMTFLENTLDQPLPRLLDFVWSYNYETNTPVDDIEAIRLTKCEKASASCKQLGIYHLGIRSKLFDGLGTVPRIECSEHIICIKVRSAGKGRLHLVRVFELLARLKTIMRQEEICCCYGNTSAVKR
ncbi:hypothetical protein AB4K20DRAFT_1982845 [Rhizopus microsporus]